MPLSVTTLRAAARWAHPVPMTQPESPTPPTVGARQPEPDLAAVRAILQTARAEGRTTLLESEGLALLAAAGIAVPRWLLVADETAVDDALLATLPR